VSVLTGWPVREGWEYLSVRVPAHRVITDKWMLCCCRYIKNICANFQEWMTNSLNSDAKVCSY